MKKFTLFLSALLISMVSMAASYVKVTAAPTDWSGEYLLVYEGETTTHVWTGVDAANGNVEATATDGTISGTDFVTITVTPMEGGYSIKVNGGVNDGKYISGKSGDNKLNFGSDAALNTLAYEEGSVKIVSNTSVMRFNSANNNMRFRYFKSTSYTGQKIVQLYKNTDGTTPEEPENPDTPDTPEEPETPTEPEQPEQPEGVLTCAEAVAICQETGETATSEQYTIRGYVTEIAYAYDAGFNNVSFWMADTKDGGKVFEAYRSTPVNDADKAVKVGDYVEVTGNLVNFKGNTPETKQGGTYTILEAAEGGEDPVEPEQPETPEEKPLTDGYTKVTSISTLANGDKVVLYCDAYGVGVAGFDGNKSGVMAETGWVEYVVELVDGGIKLKDETADQYAALPERNSFKYNAEGSVFNVTENAMLASVLDDNTYFLYYNTNNGNNPLCRMYVDKSTDERYAPFYVYEVTGSTPSAIDNVTVNQNITKFFENGQLVIIKNGVKFNAQGQVIE